MDCPLTLPSPRGPRALLGVGVARLRIPRPAASAPTCGVRPLGGGSAWTRFAGRARGGPKAGRGPGGSEGEPGPGWHGCPPPGWNKAPFRQRTGGLQKGGKQKQAAALKAPWEPNGKRLLPASDRPHFQGRGSLSAPETPAASRAASPEGTEPVRLLAPHEPG